MLTETKPPKSLLDRVLRSTALNLGVTWVICMLAFAVTGDNDQVMPWFGGAFLLAAILFGFTFLLYLARSIEGRFHWSHVTFAIVGVICAPFALTWFSPPLGGIPDESRDFILNIWFGTLVVTGILTIVHVIFMFRRRRSDARNVLDVLVGKNEADT